ncbi:MAG: hypothetical protein HYR88_17425 [Verrucomicrobia bacterium]|nr:hypothetical protein [Verrucomicrobiota bacterium]MBI3870574.1 hypothetical protein [Verrucomicrobiota bacterium]
MNRILCTLVGGFACCSLLSADLRISDITPNGDVAVQNAFSNGVVTVQRAGSPTGAWTSERSAFTTDGSARFHVGLEGKSGMFRAQAVDLAETQGPWTFQAGDILDLETLVAKLSASTDQNLASAYIAAQLSLKTQELVGAHVEGPDPALSDALITGFNDLINGAPLYAPDIFAAVGLSPSTQALIDGGATGDSLLRLNRQLLEDVYPSALLQKRAANFEKFTHSFGRLTTVAGSGQIACLTCNSWQPESEGGPALDAALSSPHITMADRAGNLYIADKRAHAIRKVDRDGIITTVAGNNVAGKGDTNPAPATLISLNNPNGLWVRGDGTFYFLDRENGYIRKVDTLGTMTALADYGGAIPGGRGLWVSEDESILYFSASSRIMSWDSTNGLSVFAEGFSDLANLLMDPGGHLVVADAARDQVTRFEFDGSRTVIAGTPSFAGIKGGDGYLATETSLVQVRGIWFLPTGAFFVCTDAPSQVWYVDTDAHIHRILNGDSTGAHDGDGAWFYANPSLHKVSNTRQITTDYDGNLLITESNFGYVRKIEFLPFPP